MTLHANVCNRKKWQSGIAAVEFAIILPVLALMLLGVIEYGWYFFREQVVQRTVSSTAAAITQNNGSIANSGPATIRTNAYNSGFNVVSYSFTGHSQTSGYVCAMSYADYNSAVSGGCGSGDWNIIAPTQDPNYVSGNPFYVAVAASAPASSLTPLFSKFIPGFITLPTVVTVGTLTPQRTWISYGSHASPKNGGRSRSKLYQNNTSAEALISIDANGGDANGNGCYMRMCDSNKANCMIMGDCNGDCAINITVPIGYWYEVVDDASGNGNCYFSNWAELSTTPIQ